MIQIKSFVFNPFQENTYILYDESKEGIIIDPGCFEQFEKNELVHWIEKNEIKIINIYNTHCHIDHVLGNDFCKSNFKVNLIIPSGEVALYRAVKTYASNYGIQGYHEAEIDKLLEEKDEINFGHSNLKSMWIPGHSPGHLVFYNEEQKVCIGGDVLFQRSIGRTDLPGGDHDTLIRSIHEKLFTLNDDLVVYPGHGPTTTIGEEKKFNPFVGLNA